MRAIFGCGVLVALAASGCGSSDDSTGTKNGGPLDPSHQALSVSSGALESCAVMADHTVKCWGANFHGELGNGSTELSSNAPVAVTGLADVVQVAVGGHFACARKSDGSVSCWGQGADGALGNGTTADASTPVQVTAVSGATALATGTTHACALVAAGEARCWGANNVAQLGTNPPLVDGKTPVPVDQLASATDISAGALHSCALVSGSAKCWGAGPNGADGSGVYYSPTTVNATMQFASLSATGSGHMCGVQTDGHVACWGQNDIGQTGSGKSDYYVSLPATVTSLEDVSAVSVGGASVQGLFVFPSTACALRGDGTVSCWGSNKAGEVGDGTTVDRSTPTAVAGASDVVSLSVGAADALDHAAHVCAAQKSGAVLCWGDNSVGQLGDGTGVSSPTPVEVVF